MDEFKPFLKNAADIFSVENASPDFENSIFVIDTNILLAPYRASNEAFEEVTKIYSKLNQKSQLFIPAQVAREFAKNRPAVLTSLHKQIINASGASLSAKLKIAPILDTDEDFIEAKRLFDEAKDFLNKHRQKMELVASKVASWSLDDPVLQQYRKIFSAKNIIECNLNNDVIDAAKVKRFKSKTPPGYKDLSKDDGGIGDLIIWSTIIQIGKEQQRDIIFITAETKEDWYHLVDGHHIFPRYELIEEYKQATKGHRLGIANLSTLLKERGADEKAVLEFEDNQADLSNSQDARFPATDIQLNQPTVAAEFRFRRRLSSASSKFPFDLSYVYGDIDFLINVSGSTIAVCVFNASEISSVKILNTLIYKSSKFAKSYNELVFVIYGAQHEIGLLPSLMEAFQLQNFLFSYIIVVESGDFEHVMANNCNHPIMQEIYSLF